MLLGLGTKAAAIVAVFHIINHASFKAALFMAAGIVDHEAHTRDIRRLGGLRRLMPVTFAITLVAALSMAGIPPLNGFLSKEMMLEEALHTPWAGIDWVFPVLVVSAALLSVGYSLRLIVHVFLGPERSDYPHHPHDPGFGMWAAPAFLAVLVVLIGLFPMTVAGDLVAATARAVTGEAVEVKIYHWHGLTAALYASVAAVACGAVALWLHGPLSRLWLATPRPEAKAIFDALVAAAARIARGLTDGLHDGALSRYLAVFTVGVLALGVWAFAGGTHTPGARAPLEAGVMSWAAWFLLVACSVLVAFMHRARIVALVLIGVVGLTVSLGFVYLSAPDLALTQISVEVVTIILLLLALNFLPKRTPAESSAARRIRDSVIAVAGGIGAGALALGVMAGNFAFPTIAEYHIANSKTEGGGTNVVNVILVDFRGYDTFGEIIVLGIAGLIIFALTEALLAGPAGRRLLSWVPDSPKAGDRHPMMLVVAARVALPLSIMVGIYIFLRGHNEPGGGFIAGLVVSIALLMQYIASGFAWAEARQRIDYHAFIGAGVVIAGATGIGAWFASRPFLTSDFGYFRIPPFEKFELATAMAFDLGVFLTVIGAVMLTLSSLTRIALRAGETVNTEPMDVDPSTAGGQEAKG
jgi:multicomponent K+:H+ antiporter subunit A